MVKALKIWLPFLEWKSFAMDVCGFVFGPKTTSYIGNFVENNIIQTRTLSSVPIAHWRSAANETNFWKFLRFTKFFAIKKIYQNLLILPEFGKCISNPSVSFVLSH